jgi:hypothetical protein
LEEFLVLVVVVQCSMESYNKCFFKKCLQLSYDGVLLVINNIAWHFEIEIGNRVSQQDEKQGNLLALGCVKHSLIFIRCATPWTEFCCIKCDSL